MVTGQASYGVVANFSVSDHCVNHGAKAWVLRNPQDGRLYVRVLSRGGRRINRFVALWRMENFRAKWLSNDAKLALHCQEYVGTLDQAQDMAHHLDIQAREERAKRNVRNIKRMAGIGQQGEQQ
jgi:hypothetical protein